MFRKNKVVLLCYRNVMNHDFILPEYFPETTSSKKKSKGKKKSTAWNKHMMAVYKSMKSKDSSVKLGDAMKAAKKTYKKGANLDFSVD